MNASPVTDWETAAVIFTFAHSSLGIAFFLALSVVMTLGVIVNMAMHEKKSFAQWKQ